jgi:hypothetical protein
MYNITQYSRHNHYIPAKTGDGRGFFDSLGFSGTVKG